MPSHDSHRSMFMCKCARAVDARELFVCGADVVYSKETSDGFENRILELERSKGFEFLRISTQGKTGKVSSFSREEKASNPFFTELFSHNGEALDGVTVWSSPSGGEGSSTLGDDVSMMEEEPPPDFEGPAGSSAAMEEGESPATATDIASSDPGASADESAADSTLHLQLKLQADGYEQRIKAAVAAAGSLSKDLRMSRAIQVQLANRIDELCHDVQLWKNKATALEATIEAGTAGDEYRRKFSDVARQLQDIRDSSACGGAWFDELPDAQKIDVLKYQKIEMQRRITDLELGVKRLIDEYTKLKRDMDQVTGQLDNKRNLESEQIRTGFDETPEGQAPKVFTFYQMQVVRLDLAIAKDLVEKLYNQVSEKNEQLDNALAEVRRARIRCGRDAVGPEEQSLAVSVVMLSNGLVNCRGEVKDLKERIKSLELELRDSQAQVRGLRNASTNPSLDEYLISESRLRCTLEDAQTRIAVLERTLAEERSQNDFRMNYQLQVAREAKICIEQAEKRSVNVEKQLQITLQREAALKARVDALEGGNDSELATLRDKIKKMEVNKGGRASSSRR